jgi:antitoxin VapB
MIKRCNMETAKLFQNGRSQAVRLPKNYNFTGKDVFIQKVGETVILFPKDKVWETFLEGLNGFTDDFMANGREQPEMQEREGL